MYAVGVTELVSSCGGCVAHRRLAEDELTVRDLLGQSCARDRGHDTSQDLKFVVRIGSGVLVLVWIVPMRSVLVVSGIAVGFIRRC